MSVNKVKAARLLGAAHHTEGLGPGGHAPSLREQAVTLTDGRSPYHMHAQTHLLSGAAGGNVMPIMRGVEPVPSVLGTHFLPSERFGAGATLSLAELPGPPNIPRMMGATNSNGPGPPSIGSPGRFSSEAISGKESLYPMYQY
jgi:hypothetical protein